MWYCVYIHNVDLFSFRFFRLLFPLKLTEILLGRMIYGWIFTFKLLLRSFLEAFHEVLFNTTVKNPIQFLQLIVDNLYVPMMRKFIRLYIGVNYA